jgi:hypothetical protein
MSFLCMLCMTDQVFSNDSSGRVFYFTRAAFFGQLSEVFLKETKVRKVKGKDKSGYGMKIQNHSPLNFIWYLPNTKQKIKLLHRDFREIECRTVYALSKN